MNVAWEVQEAAWAVAEMAVTGALPVRTVVVPNGRLAHTIRRLLVRAGRAAALAGTRFTTVLDLAREALVGAQAAFSPGEEGRRAPRLVRLLRTGALPLKALDASLLGDAGGWADAIAGAIGELEAAGQTAASLASGASDGWERDLATIWEALDGDAADSWTAPRAIAEAVARGLRGPQPILAILTGEESTVEAEFLRTSAARCVFLGARPLDGELLERVGRLWGEEAAGALRASRPKTSGFFGPSADAAARLAASIHGGVDPEPVRSGAAASAVEGDRAGEDPDEETLGPAVELVEFSGVDEEIELAVDWVAREVLDRHTPLAEIALLLPEPDPLASLLVARLARLPWGSDDPPVHVAGGLPLSFLADGAQLLAVLRALAEGLPGERLLDLLCTLRTARPENDVPDAPNPVPTPPRLSREQARRVLVSIGALGPSVIEAGAIEDPSGVSRTVRDRLSERIALLEPASATTPASAHDRPAFDEDRHTLSWLRAAAPALDALLALGERVRDGARLDELARGVRRFAGDFLFTPSSRRPDASALQERMRVSDRVAPAYADLAAGEPDATGYDAINALEAVTRRIRIPYGRFGAPRVYVGTVRDAIGIPFRAVRFLGMAEGGFPGPVREDPVLSDARRRRLAPSMPRRSGRPAADARALHRVLLETTSRPGARLVFSTARVDVAGTTHEPSALFLEIASILDPGAPPDLGALRRGFCLPALLRARLDRTRRPPDAAASLDRAARMRAIPAAAWREPALDLVRIGTLTGPSAPEAEHLDAAALPAPRGLHADHPISASDLKLLLECPHRFLQERVLRRRAPEPLPGTRDLGLSAFGTIYHLALERFFRLHRDSFARRERALARAERLPPAWEDEGREAARAALEERTRWHPLDGGAREGLRTRLENAVVAFLRHEWERPPREHLAGEREFGYEPPLRLRARDVELFVRGRIDRLDRESDGTILVRDFKTGAPRPRERDDAGPVPSIDLQLALYLLAVRALAGTWGLSGGLAGAYSYVTHWSVEERAFREDAGALLDAGERWLVIAGGLLAARAFPRTPAEEDCAFCPFRPVCGPDAQTRARESYASLAADGPVARFVTMKLPPEDP